MQRTLEANPHFLGYFLASENQNSFSETKTKTSSCTFPAMFNKVKILVVALAQRSFVGATKSAIEVLFWDKKFQNSEKSAT